MTPAMTHEDVRAALAGDEAAAVRAHLEGCPECRRELASLEETAAALAHAASPVPMDAERAARMRARLLARATADRAGAPSAHAAAPADAPVPGVIPIARASERRGLNAGWLAAAAAVLLLVAVGAWAARLKGRYDALNEQYASVDADRSVLLRAVARRDSTLAALSGPGVRVIELASTQRQAPGGRMFWDPGTARWTFFAHRLPALRPGRDYQLWLITPAGPVSAGTFKPTRDGTAEVQATYPLPRDQLRAVAVTDEPEGGLPQPSTTPIIAGTFGSTE